MTHSRALRDAIYLALTLICQDVACQTAQRPMESVSSSKLFCTSVSAITKGFRCSPATVCLLFKVLHTNVSETSKKLSIYLCTKEVKSFSGCYWRSVNTGHGLYCGCELVHLLLQGWRAWFWGFSFLMLGYREEQMETDILSSLIQHMYCNCFFWQHTIIHAHCSCSVTNVFKSNLMNFKFLLFSSF